MDIEGEILRKVGKILLVGFLIAIIVGTSCYLGFRQWFWYKVDQEVAYQMERLRVTSFGDIVSRSEVRFVKVWLWTATIDILVVHLLHDEKTVFIIVNARNQDGAPHSYHAQVTSVDGFTGTWSKWTQNIYEE